MQEKKPFILVEFFSFSNCLGMLYGLFYSSNPKPVRSSWIPAFFFFHVMLSYSVCFLFLAAASTTPSDPCDVSLLEPNSTYYRAGYGLYNS